MKMCSACSKRRHQFLIDYRETRQDKTNKETDASRDKLQITNQILQFRLRDISQFF